MGFNEIRNTRSIGAVVSLFVCNTIHGGKNLTMAEKGVNNQV